MGHIILDLTSMGPWTDPFLGCWSYVLRVFLWKLPMPFQSHSLVLNGSSLCFLHSTQRCQESLQETKKRALLDWLETTVPPVKNSLRRKLSILASRLQWFACVTILGWIGAFLLRFITPSTIGLGQSIWAPRTKYSSLISWPLFSLDAAPSLCSSWAFTWVCRL